MKLIMLGPPGSGKGTQAGKISAHYGIPHISTGQMFRQIKKENTELGQRVRDTIDQGKLMPDDLTAEMVKKRLLHPDAANGFILDGYPRNLNQAHLLDSISDVDFVIHLEVRDEEVERRISSRRLCKQCGASYNLIFLPPMKPDTCDRCNGTLMLREDDKPEKVRERLLIYHEQTDPLVKYYEERGKILRVNGEQPIPKVYDDIIASIGSRQL